MVRQIAARDLLTGARESNGSGRPEALVESYRRLAEVFHHVLSAQSLDALLDRIADTLRDLIPYEALHVYEADEEARELVPVLARSEYEDEIMQRRPLFGQGITGWAVENRRPVWTNRAHLDPRMLHVPGTPIEPEALITVPLIARGALKGALNIYRIGEDAAFYEHEFELAKWFADAAALAIDNAQVKARLEHLAQTDSLTGLYNHRFFHERLRSELTRASRSHDPVAVLMFDLDDFKRVNDTYGHPQGDAVLRAVGRILEAESRAIDAPARYGGEEFVVALPETDREGAYEFGERFRERIAAEAVPLVDGGGAIRVTASLGAATMPGAAHDVEALFAAADAALYDAKRTGKNRVVQAPDLTVSERLAPDLG